MSALSELDEYISRNDPAHVALRSSFTNPITTVATVPDTKVTIDYVMHAVVVIVHVQPLCRCLTGKQTICVHRDLSIIPHF